MSECTEQVPATVQQYVVRRKALAAFGVVRQTEHDGVLWVATNHWLLACGPSDTTCSAERADYGWQFAQSIPPARQKGETREVKSLVCGAAVRIGDAWVGTNLIWLVEDMHGAVTWHSAGPIALMVALSTPGGKVPTDCL